jgi:hypothetical protein
MMADQLPSKPSTESPYFTIKEGPKGRGLFALSGSIVRGALLHSAPCLAVSADEYQRHLKHTLLEHYVFKSKAGNMLLALGYGSLFNHSKHPNVDYRIGDDDCIHFYSSSYRTIRSGDELCISYGSNLWFEDASDGESEDDADADAGITFLTRIQLDDTSASNNIGSEQGLS